MKKSFKNKYGSLEISSCSKLENVSTMNYSRAVEHRANIFSISVAEQIALITNNQMIQVGVVDIEKCYIILHETPDMGYYCRIDSIDFLPEDKSAQTIIDDLHKSSGTAIV